MRKFIVLLLAVFSFSVLAVAQDETVQPKQMSLPNHEAFIGYHYQHASTSGSGLADSANLNGFAFEYSQYFWGQWGLTLDVAHAGNNKLDSTGIKYKRTSIMGGPTYRFRNKLTMFTPSVHVLAGTDRDDFTVPNNPVNTTDYRDNQLAVAAGVTVDGNLTRHLAIRVAQVDYIYTNHYSTNQSSFRVVAGFLVRF